MEEMNRFGTDTSAEINDAAMFPRRENTTARKDADVERISKGNDLLEELARSGLHTMAGLPFKNTILFTKLVEALTDADVGPDKSAVPVTLPPTMEECRRALTEKLVIVIRPRGYALYNASVMSELDEKLGHIFGTNETPPWNADGTVPLGGHAGMKDGEKPQLDDLLAAIVAQG